MADKPCHFRQRARGGAPALFIPLLGLLTLLPRAGATVGCPGRCGIDKKVPRGMCEYSETPTCSCNDQWSGGAYDCSERLCPAETAWFDRPVAKDTAHTTKLTCSGRGSCSSAIGACVCDADYEGSACERSRCPATPQGACSGHGRCVTLRKAGLLRTPEPADYRGWDAERIQGCLCDPGWTSFDCSERTCVFSADPLSMGPVEIQALTTNIAYSPETQTLNVAGTATAGGTGLGTGGADIDEVQTLDVGGTLELPTGTITITMDCRPTATPMGCALWPDARRVQQTTAAITLSNTPSVTAANVQAALEALPMIGTNQLTVTVTQTSSARNHRISVTFRGSDVGGMLVPLSVDMTGCNVVTGILTQPAPVAQTTVGSEVQGTISLSWDDTASTPSYASLTTAACADTEDGNAMLPFGALSTGTVTVTATEAAIAGVISGMVFNCPPGASPSTPCPREAPPAGAIQVRKLSTHGPGVAIAITFAGGARARGDVAPLTVTANTLAVVATGLTGDAAAVTVSEQKGNFIKGNLDLKVYYKTDTAGNAAPTPALTVPWCASVATMATALNTYESSKGYGYIEVARARALIAGVGVAGAPAWTGGYTWRVTFRGVAEDVDPIEGLTTALTDSAGTAGVPFFSNVEVQQGSVAGEVAEVQLMDCECATCGAGNYIRLAFGNEVTGQIAHDANAAAIRAALAALPGLQDVLVSQFTTGGAAATSMCSAAGTTTAITFAWSGGQQPPLRIAGKPVKDGNKLPASASLHFHYSRGWGLHGGRAKKGTRPLKSCSGRGRCDVNTGACVCYNNWGVTDGGLPPQAQPADPDAGGFTGSIADSVANCGRPPAGIAAVTDCPTVTVTPCSGRGTCGGPPEYKCQCDAGYTGPACAERLCDQAPAWFSQPEPADPLDTGTVAVGPGGTTLAYTAASAHMPSSCGGMGRCGFDTGKCLCKSGWGGLNCGLSMCPGQTAQPGLVTNETCLNGAPCVTLNAMASKYLLDTSTDALFGPGTLDPQGLGAEDYTLPWDANGAVRGCACEALPPAYLGPFAFNYARWQGYSCGVLSCPGGPDPHDPRAFEGIEDQWEVQAIKCNMDYTIAPKGRIGFRWFNATGTTGIRLDAFVFDRDRPGNPLLQDRATLEMGLQRLPSFMPFSIDVVDYSNGDPATGTVLPSVLQPSFCDTTGKRVVYVTFVGHYGDQPMLEVVPDNLAQAGGTNGGVQVWEVRKGRAQYLECNRRGVCDRNTGRCKCQPGFESSDGYGRRGQLGDCGYYVTAVQPLSETASAF